MGTVGVNLLFKFYNLVPAVDSWCNTFVFSCTLKILMKAQVDNREQLMEIQLLIPLLSKTHEEQNDRA